MENKREERRRRILEGESDRMALITGRLQNLKPSSTSQHLKDSCESEHEITKEVISAGDKNRNIASQIEPHQDDLKPETQLASRPSKPRLITRKRPRFFSSKRINSCIIASEGTRIFCALVIAFLVVLSYIDYPLFGRNIVRSESVVASRPLYILLITDVTIVIARLYLEQEEEEEEEEEEERARFQGDAQSWTQAVTVMERGLVAYQAFRGVFIDCSVYAVVVICGLSFV